LLSIIYAFHSNAGFFEGSDNEAASLRQHYLDQVQRVCRTPAQHSQPSRPIFGTTGWLPCNSGKIDRSGRMVKNEKRVSLSDLLIALLFAITAHSGR